MFTLAIACLTTSNLLWFMDLTLQVPMQYCSLQHWTLLPSPVTFTTGCCLYFGSVSSFFLELFLHWSAVPGLTGLQYQPGEFISQCPIWCLFILLMGFSRQEYKNTEVVCLSLLQWPTFCQNPPPWPVHLGWPHTAWLIVSLRQVCGPCDSLVSFLWLRFSVCLPSDGEG